MNVQSSKDSHLVQLCLAVIIMTFGTSLSWALDCDTEDIGLRSQAEVDSFQSQFGQGDICDTIVGRLIIAGDDIVNLSPLSDLKTIGAGIVVEENLLLDNLDELSGLTSVGLDCDKFNFTCPSVTVRENASLKNIDGLSGLTDIEGDVIISENPLLENLKGPFGIISIGGSLEIMENNSLTHIDGLSSLASVGGSFMASLEIISNPALTNIDGLGSLTHTDGLWISRNPALTNIDGLSSLMDVTLEIVIYDNDSLTNLDSLSSVQQVRDLSVEDNSALSDCQGLIKLVDPIDDYEPGPGPGPSGAPDIQISADLRKNLPGCNSINEILAKEPISAINAGFNDAWFNQETNSQGFFIVVYPDLEQMFVTWYTYDLGRPDDSVTAQLGGPGQRWLTAQGGFINNRASLQVWVAKGGVFDSPTPEPYLEADGEFIVEFTTCNEGTITYDIPSVNLQGEVPIERIALDNVPICYLLNHEAEALIGGN